MSDIKQHSVCGNDKLIYFLDFSDRMLNMKSLTIRKNIGGKSRINMELLVTFPVTM